MIYRLTYVWGRRQLLFVGLHLILFLILARLSLAFPIGEHIHPGDGARALGMGRAFVAIADDYTANIWNPAGLAQLEGFRSGGSISHAPSWFGYEGQRVRELLGHLALQIPRLGAFSYTLHQYEFGYQFMESGAYRGQGEMAHYMGWGIPVDRVFSFGLCLKYVTSYEKFFSTVQLGKMWLGSGGVLFRIKDNCKIGIAAYNCHISSEDGELLPGVEKLRIGFVWEDKTKDHRLACDVGFPRASSGPYLYMGGERRIGKHYLRVGLSHSQVFSLADQVPWMVTGGWGWDVSGWRVDYGLGVFLFRNDIQQREGLVGVIHRLSVSKEIWE